MSVSISVHRVARVQVERHDRDGHSWTKFRMVGADGFEVFVVDVFAAYHGHVEIDDDQQTTISTLESAETIDADLL